jgi:nucleoid DNA-binding protein
MNAKRGPYPGKPSGLGKGILQRAVTEAGMSCRQAALVVDTVIDSWKKALTRGEEVETPVGTLRVVKRNREERRVFKSTPNLKGIKHKMYVENRTKCAIQLLKKQLPGEPTPLPREREASVLPALPVAMNKPASPVDRDSRLFRQMHLAHFDQNDLR